MLDAKDNYLFIKKEEQEQEQKERKTRDCLLFSDSLIILKKDDHGVLDISSKSLYVCITNFERFVRLRNPGFP